MRKTYMCECCGTFISIDIKSRSSEPNMQADGCFVCKQYTNHSGRIVSADPITVKRLLAGETPFATTKYSAKFLFGLTRHRGSTLAILQALVINPRAQVIVSNELIADQLKEKYNSLLEVYFARGFWGNFKLIRSFRRKQRGKITPEFHALSKMKNIATGSDPIFFDNSILNEL